MAMLLLKARECAGRLSEPCQQAGPGEGLRCQCPSFITADGQFHACKCVTLREWVNEWLLVMVARGTGISFYSQAVHCVAALP